MLFRIEICFVASQRNDWIVIRFVKIANQKLVGLAQEIPIKYIRHYVSTIYMFILNIMIHRWDNVKLICLCVEFSEVFLKGLYVTLSLKHCIFLNSCSGIAFSAKQIL